MIADNFDLDSLSREKLIILIREERHLHAHDMYDQALKHRVLLRDKIAQYVCDAIDAIEIERSEIHAPRADHTSAPTALDAALSRLNSVLATIARATATK